MRRITNPVATVCLAFTLQTVCATAGAQVTNERAARAAGEWQSALNRKRGIRPNEFFLITFKASQQPDASSLDEAVRGQDLWVSAVHVKGDSADGTFAFFIARDQPLAQQLQAVASQVPSARGDVLKQMARLHAAAGASSPEQTAPTGPKAGAPVKFCGMEVRGRLPAVERLTVNLHARISSIEIITDKIRMFPKCE